MTDSHSQAALVIHGRKLDVSQEPGLVRGRAADILQATPRIDGAMEIGRARSENADSLSITNRDDIVELRLEDDLFLYTSVQRLREEIIPGTQRGTAADETALPARLILTDRRTRGEEGLLIKSVKVLDLKGKLSEAAAEKAGELAARRIAEKIEEQLIGPDILYRLVRNTSATPTVTLKTATAEEVNSSRPILLFMHGTASSTQGSFSELWEPSNSIDDTVWEDLQEYYQNNIFALEHRTLTHSPIDNAVDLLEKLPTGCRLHLVSHSRGGLVGELLCRGRFNNAREPFTDQDIALFDSDGFSGFSGLFAETEKDYRHHRRQLRKLNSLLLEKQPVIERFVRVACPARGTTLASGKLDIYLSGILNVIGLIPPLKASPIYELLKAFVLAVAKERTRPEQIPGLEVQMPGSPFIAMLNSAPESVQAHLAVIKGDIEPTGILKKISLFFLDRFYESDHDLVVNTPSMDGGGRRDSRIPVLFDQGAEINHFRYFENARTRSGLLSGLTDATLPPRGFKLEEQKDAHIARMAAAPVTTEELPTVFVLPGITGSYLSLNGDRIWIDFFDLVRGRFTDLRITAKQVTALQPVPSVYGDLIDYLSRSHVVIPFGYDWRKSVLETGRELGKAVSERLKGSTKPVHIIAHSMGGLVARAMMSQCAQTWEDMCNRAGSRVLMLGTPNRGSYSIPRIFARQERLIRMLALADLRHDQDQLLNTVRKFPGVLELLPVDKTGRIEIEDQLWDEFKTIFGKQWKRPTRTALKQARTTWRELFRARLNPKVVFYIAGHADATPSSVTVATDDSDKKEIRFTATANGDGQVSWQTGIPEGINHWFVNAAHGDIPGYRPAYKAFVQILETGSTQLLATQAPAARGVDEEQELPPDRVDIFPSEEQLVAAGMGRDIHKGGKKRPGRPPLQVSVIHGNLCFAQSPLAVGHYQGDTIVSAEAALDERLDHRLSRRQRSGVYPGPLMTNEILLGDQGGPFPGAVIVGLGIVGDLTPGALTRSFRDAVIRFGLICREKNFFKDRPITLSTMLIGTGARYLSVQDSLTALLRGVLQANAVLAGPADNADLTVAGLDFIELYEDIAIDAQYALLECVRSIEFKNAVTCDKTITEGNGGRTRAHFNEDTQWWQRLRIEGTDDGGLKYTTFTARARADMRIQPVQRQSVEPFLKELTTETSMSRNAGRVLFELLVPAELKGRAAENRRLMLVVDATAAAYPWELMEYAGREGNEALAITSGMIRQLATEHIVPAHICTDLKALVVGDPFVGADKGFPELPGAREEAREVAQVLEQSGVEIREKNLLIRETGAKILSRLMTGGFGILHLAGHGVVDYELPEEVHLPGSGNPAQKKSRRVTGMLIGDNQFLTPIEIRQMPVTPAFVFINCCHLGKIGGDREQYMEKRYHLAANLASQLIEQGVKTVIAAGWAVNDAAALTFAQTFYTVFLQGRCFGEAVKEARETTQRRHPTVNTWGAYQCYGDPGFTLTEQLNRQEPPEIQPFVSLAEYVVALKNIGEDAKTAATEPKLNALRRRLRAIRENLPEKYEKNPQVRAALKKACKNLDLE